MVTVKFGELEFHNPVWEGQIVDFYVSNPVVGKTSLRFDIEGYTAGDRLVVRTSAVFVSVDKDYKPKRIDKYNLR